MEPMPLPGHIVLTDSPEGELSRLLASKIYSSIAVLVDSNTLAHCYPALKGCLPAHQLIEIKPGEEYKNLDTCAQVWRALTQMQADRKGLLIVLGGGVAGDLGGFCAATYKRGIDFILVPTTLLAQVDASVGGKLGIDFEGFKNQIGVFQEPVATFIWPGFLATLSPAEIRSGFAEIIKHCLISDKAMWATVQSKTLDNQNFKELIHHSIAFKATVTQQDPKEAGLRKILNFGHTIGHAVESFFLNRENKLLHGEAIAVGMVAEAWLAAQRGLLTEIELAEISHYILTIFGKVPLPDDLTPIASLALQDKKNEGSKILMAVPNGIGKPIWDVEISLAEIIQGLRYYSLL